MLYHAFRRYAKKVSYEKQLKDKGKIDGAYLLIKRFKNRLKCLDEVIKKISAEKASLDQFEKL